MRLECAHSTVGAGARPKDDDEFNPAIPFPFGFRSRCRTAAASRKHHCHTQHAKDNCHSLFHKNIFHKNTPSLFLNPKILSKPNTLNFIPLLPKPVNKLFLLGGCFLGPTIYPAA
jgi:hypothetical protein